MQVEWCTAQHLQATALMSGRVSGLLPGVQVRLQIFSILQTNYEPTRPLESTQFPG